MAQKLGPAFAAILAGNLELLTPGAVGVDLSATTVCPFAARGALWSPWTPDRFLGSLEQEQPRLDQQIVSRACQVRYAPPLGQVSKLCGVGVRTSRRIRQLGKLGLRIQSLALEAQS